MIQLTGIATAETHRFLKWARYEKTVPVWVNSYVDNPIKKLQENLARDLVSLEDTDLVSEQQLDKITDAYAQVYDIISKAVDKPQE